MATFQAFLEQLAQRHHEPERRQRREEWIAAVGRLMAQIRAWLSESDPNRLLDILSLTVEKWEPSLGRCELPSLRIGVGEKAVRVDPIGRDALGFLKLRQQAEMSVAGRVDITDGIRGYILYRALPEGKEIWYALDERFEAAILDRSRLEQILQDLLA
jgi:hypothetical protein